MKNYNNKNTILLVLILVMLLIVLVVLYQKSSKSSNQEKNNNNTNEKYVDKRGRNYIVINDYVYSFFKDYLISISRDITKDGLVYNVYNDNVYIAKGTLKKLSKWNVLDENGKYVNYRGNLFAYSSNLDVKLSYYHENIFTESDFNLIKNQYGDINSNDITFLKKYETDINGNLTQDNIFVLISEQNPQDGNTKKNNYHLIIASVDDKLYEVQYVKHRMNKTYPNFYLNAIFVEDSNVFISFDAKYNPWDIDEDYNIIYRFDDTKFTKIIDK